MGKKSTIAANNVNYSYWETQQYFRTFDLIVIGSGIVGLSTAISFKQKNKKASVLVLERGILPSGASTKNAGFACFGSPSELLDDLAKMPEKTVWQTVEMRWKGLQILQKRLGPKNMDLQNLGGYELFDDEEELERCREKTGYLNKMTFHSIGLKNAYSEVKKKQNLFGGIKGTFLNRYESQINTGKMMQSLIELALHNGIKILNNISIENIHDSEKEVALRSAAGIFKARKVVVATNGFAKELLKLKDVEPARAQVLITRPIPGLKIRGTFHYQKGYYYFRNIDDRILFGGGRNLDPEGENTWESGLSDRIQHRLDELLRELILPGVKHEVELRWSGIMGVGGEKKPIVEFVSKNVLAAVRMGGMGIAIGSLVGNMASKKISEA
jgi:gamma-glutamylputrescine oxidase